MFAIIRTGGKQYRVAAEDVIAVEKLPGDAGEQVLFEEVLLIGDGDEATVGAPLVAGATVAGEVVEQTRARKILVFKKKRRKGYRRTHGHRQHLTEVKITEILLDGAKPAAKKAKSKPTEKKAEAKPDEASSEAKAAEPKAAKAKETKAKDETAKAKAAPAKAAETKAEDKDSKPAAEKATAKDKQGD